MTNTLVKSSAATAGKLQVPFVSFENLYSLLDGMMLYGAALTKADAQGMRIRLEISRTRRHWSTLYVGVAMLEMHGIQVQLCSGEKTLMSRQEKLVYKSSPQALFKPAFERWYGTDGKQAILPDGLELTEESLVLWLVGHLGKISRERLRLTAPTLSRKNAEALSIQLNERGIEVAVVRAGRFYALQLSKAGTLAACEWLETNFNIDTKMI